MKEIGTVYSTEMGVWPRGHCIDWLDSEVVIEVMSREVEVCGDVYADSVDNIGAVVVVVLCMHPMYCLLQVMRYLIIITLGGHVTG